MGLRTADTLADIYVQRTKHSGYSVQRSLGKRVHLVRDRRIRKYLGPLVRPHDRANFSLTRSHTLREHNPNFLSSFYHFVNALFSFFSFILLQRYYNEKYYNEIGLVVFN